MAGGREYVFPVAAYKFIKLNLDVINGIQEVIAEADAAQQPQGNLLAPFPHDGPGQGLANQLAGHLANRVLIAESRACIRN